MADFTAKEMRKLANLMESAVQGNPVSENWEDERSEEDRHEHRDVGRMIYQMAIKNNDGYQFESLISSMTGAGMNGLTDLTSDDWLQHYGEGLNETSMVASFIDHMIYEIIPGANEPEVTEIFRGMTSRTETFKGLIYVLKEFAEEDYDGNLEDYIPYIKLLDTLPLL